MGRERTEVVIGERFRAGDSILALSSDYKMNMAEIEAIIRTSLSRELRIIDELDPEENVSLRKGSVVYNLHNCKFEILTPPNNQ